MKSISALEREAKTVFSSAFAVADAEMAQIPESKILKGHSIGQMFAVMAQAEANDPDVVANRIVSKLMKSIDDGSQKIYEAKKTLNNLNHAVAFLNGDRSAINQIDDVAIKNSAKTVKSGADAGLTDAIATAKQIEHYLNEASEILDHLSNKFIAQTISAANCQSARVKWLAALKSDSPMASIYQRRLDRLKMVHKKKFHVQKVNGMKGIK